MAATKWELSLAREGEKPSVSVSMTDAEVEEIVQQLEGSCLSAEAELRWLFVEAGVPQPTVRRHFMLSVPITDDQLDSDFVEETITAALSAAGVDMDEVDVSFDF